MDPFWGPFILYCEQVENSRRGFDKITRCTVAVEACYSGGLGETAEQAKLPGIIFLTAASPYETSKADERNEEMGVYLTNSFTRGFTELLNEAPDASLRDMYIEIASKISGSHVQLYNIKNYGNIYKETMGEFFVIK